jgi:hypothetical protein
MIAHDAADFAHAGRFVHVASLSPQEPYDLGPRL